MDVTELTRKAAAGSCAAQTTLGFYYLFGYGPVKVNYDEAFRLLSLASEQGATRAIANLADMYAQGLGTAQNMEKAIDLYENVGEVEFFAALALGRIYSQGLGVQADRQRALKWYSAVASFEEPGFNYEALNTELSEAKEYIRDFETLR